MSFNKKLIFFSEVVTFKNFDRLDLNCWSVHNEETFTLNRFHPGFEFDMTLMCDAEEING